MPLAPALVQSAAGSIAHALSMAAVGCFLQGRRGWCLLRQRRAARGSTPCSPPSAYRAQTNPLSR
jgi:hypothetical protein